MASGPTASRLRQRIASLKAKRDRLEQTLLVRRGMVDACWVERYGLAGGKRRRSPACYLSRKVLGRTRLTYVRKGELKRLRAATDQWRTFSQAMAQWVQVSQELERLLRELGRAQLIE